MLFSVTPVGPMAPVSLPPCPGSRTMRLPSMPGAALLWLLGRAGTEAAPAEDASSDPPAVSTSPDGFLPRSKSMFEPPEEAPPAEDALLPALPERLPKSMTTRYGTGPPSRENTS